MSFDRYSQPAGVKSSQEGKMDPKVQEFIQTYQMQEQVIQQTEKITDMCWDLCNITLKDRLDSKQELCISNCVHRYFDVANFIATRFTQKVQQQINH